MPTTAEAAAIGDTPSIARGSYLAGSGDASVLKAIDGGDKSEGENTGVPIGTCPESTTFSQRGFAPVEDTDLAHDYVGWSVFWDNFSGVADPITHIRWWGGVRRWAEGEEGGSLPTENQVAFRPDDSGRPVSESSTRRDLSPTITLETSPGSAVDVYRFDAVLPTPVEMAEGWISIHADSGEGEGGLASFAWLKAGEGDGRSFEQFDCAQKASQTKVSKLECEGEIGLDPFVPRDFDLAFCLGTADTVEGEDEAEVPQPGEGEGQPDGEAEVPHPEEGEGEREGGPGIAWSSYVGGPSVDWGSGVTVDAVGNVLVTGHTSSSGWVSGGWDTTLDGYYDAFVVKLTASGAHLWSTYVGGNRSDFGSGIAVDGSGNVFVTGRTESSGWLSGGWDTTYGSIFDGFAVKLTPEGAFVWGSYLGGDDHDRGSGIAVDSSGNAVVTGYTRSSDWVSGGQNTTRNATDAFVVRLTAEGAHSWSTYVGGMGNDYGSGIAVDAVGSILVTGRTKASGWISGGWDTALDGSTDAFVVKLTSEGAHDWSSYLGGDESEHGAGIAVDSAGNVLVAGKTESSGWVSGGWDTTLEGGPQKDVTEGEEWGDIDGFVVKLTASGAHVWSTYLGGSDDESGNAIAVDGAGDIVVTGETYSLGWISGGWDTALGGSSDAFVVKLTSLGAHAWSSYVGGDNEDSGNGVVVDGAGKILVVGLTGSADWVSGGWDTTRGGYDAFVAKIAAGKATSEGEGGEVPPEEGEADEGAGEGEDERKEPAKFLNCAGGDTFPAGSPAGDVLVLLLLSLVLLSQLRRYSRRTESV